tara:strand:- start:825 stop:1574 length:750 start_codon:yes stop_codon:yes gene_type:complete
MISCKLTGGLGNYLFQIAAASTLAHKNNDDTLFDFVDVGQAHKNINLYTDTILRNISIGNPAHEHIYSEPSDFSYREIPYTKNLMLEGYFQSAKYLDREHILELYKIDDDTQEYIDARYSFRLKNSISIHIRRGDYIGRSNHPVQGMEYYNEAIKHFSNANFIVFSDDIEWCKENFKGDEFTFIEEDDYIELYLMSMCQHNIIANSTFSWWGAWLNKNKDKMVIAPSNWFGTNKKLKTENIYGKNWIVL